jgi:hypothetical protein
MVLHLAQIYAEFLSRILTGAARTRASTTPGARRPSPATPRKPRPRPAASTRPLLRRRQLTEDGNVKITGRDLRERTPPVGQGSLFGETGSARVL